MEALVAADSKKVAFSFDLDDVISGKQKAGFSDFVPLVGMFWECPMLATAALPHNQQAITNYAQSLTDVQKYNGSTNIIRGVIQYLKDNGYGDVSSYEREVNKRTQKPFPVLRMIANIKVLKDLGYPVFGATNQDCEQYEVYREHLKSEHKIDLKDLFEGVVTTRVYHHDRSEGHGVVYKPKEDDHIYVLHKKEHVKPSAEYFQGVAQVIKGLNPQVGQIVHTDDKWENTKGAEEAGFNSIHFKLAGETVRKTSPEDLEATITAWENELANTYGINLKK
jgi:hypothetical protein